MPPVLQVSGIDHQEHLYSFVVVDTLIDGKGMGGTRMTETVTAHEVAGLARKMSEKLAIAELPIGGAKAGIVSGKLAGDERDARLRAFGRVVGPLLHGGVYLGSDQGVSHRDRDVFFAAAGYDVALGSAGTPLPCSWERLWERCEDVTGFGVCQGIAAAMPLLQPDRDRPGSASIQGFGAVGRSVATHLVRSGFSITAVADRLGTVASREGLDVDALRAATDAAGTIDRQRLTSDVTCTSSEDAWLDADADVLVLAAGGDAINIGNVRRVRARVVVEGANAACSPEALEALRLVGVPVLPDIVVNVGGAAVTGLILTGLAPRVEDIDELGTWLYQDIAARISRNTAEVVGRFRAGGGSLPACAAELAAERLARRRSGERPQTLKASA